MIKVNQIKVPVGISNNDLNEYIFNQLVKKLKINRVNILNYEIAKRSLDSRKCNELNYVYSLNVYVKNEKNIKLNNKDVIFSDEYKYEFPYSANNNESNPIIIGMGPAGLFCAYMLAKAGFKPIVFERGKNIQDRTEDVKKYWETGILDIHSNVQFGEGGAGAFSDGKLNTLVKDKNGRNREVLNILVDNGAPRDILFENKPHIGTDLLVKVVTNIRNKIIEYGGEIHYESCVTDFELKDNVLDSIIVNNTLVKCSHVCLAIGHSARDTFFVLHKKEVPMDAKSFAVGFRVMHPQSLIDENQYGKENLHYDLPPSSYKLTYTASNNRGVYSFCMCPGGYVINSSSSENKMVVNGMSYHARDSKIANSAIIVSVTPDDFDSNEALSGVKFQERLENEAYKLANGSIPIQKYGDFKYHVKGTDSIYNLEFEPAIKGLYKEADLSKLFSEDINDSFIEGMENFGKKIKNFNDGNVILAGIESRTSSPVRIWRDNESGMSPVKGLYPCGEGAGYAGGITSAAMDGIFIAECIAKSIINME